MVVVVDTGDAVVDTEDAVVGIIMVIIAEGEVIIAEGVVDHTISPGLKRRKIVFRKLAIRFLPLLDYIRIII